MSTIRTNKTADGDARRSLASMSVLLADPRIELLVARHARAVVLDALRASVNAFRLEMKSGAAAPGADRIVERAAAMLDGQDHDRLQPVVNATGIILHTGLGRAVLPRQAVIALASMDRCCNLQIDLDTGLRGKRCHAIERLLCRLTGAEDALVVNNNAAATMLILTALCRDREVVISRGQLIEIGGSFRLPDCVHQSGAKLVEVGTTNRTHLRDYAAALCERTGAVMRVNPSNYRIEGFTREVPVDELVTLKNGRDVIVIDDLGCGALVDLEEFGLPHEPTVQESVRAGADVVCFSGDKLIGGPQAGIIVGRKSSLANIRKHPLTRMLRIGKLDAIALEQTLRLFLRPETLRESHPTLRMLATPVHVLRRQAERVRRKLESAGAAVRIRTVACNSETGGGSLPAVQIPSHALAISSDAAAVDDLCARLRRHTPPIIGRIHNGELFLDMRTLLDGDVQTIERALITLFGHQIQDS